MPRYCIYGDVHLRVDLLDAFIKKNKDNFDSIIFLGDYFHAFNDNVTENILMARFIKEKLLTLPNIVLLIGNHDLPHIYGANQVTWCPGWTKEKHDGIKDILKGEDWAQFKDYILIDDWLISHGGFSNSIYGHPHDGVTIPYIDMVLKQAYIYLKANMRHPVFEAGYSCGGTQPFGGHLWQRWNEMIPLENFKQIVGHTICETPRCKFYNKKNELIEGSFEKLFAAQKYPNFCVNLDCNNRYFGILENNILSIHETEKFL